MIVLVLGVIAAFYVGMKLGEIKGYMMGGYGSMPIRHHGWMVDKSMTDRPVVPQQVQ